MEINALLVEDNVADVVLIREALEAHQIAFCLHVLSDGEQAIDYFVQMGKSGATPCPDILLLDLNIPKAEGAEVLKEFRRHRDCLDTPVIVISSSDNPRDKSKVNALGVTHYFKKPSSFDAFMRLGEVVRSALELQSAADEGGSEGSV